MTAASKSRSPAEGGEEQGRTDGGSYLLTGQVLLSSQWHRGAGRTVSLLSSTCFSMLFLSLLFSFWSFRLFVVILFLCVYPTSVMSCCSKYSRESETVHCVTALTAENSIITTLLHEIGLLSALSTQASQITTYCTAACNVRPPQQQARKEAYRIKKPQIAESGETSRSGTWCLHSV